MKHFTLILTFILLFTLSLQANNNNPIKMARFPTPSPDGKELVFSYQGDLWRVSIEGGEAYRLTVHKAYDRFPQWSPDGKEIAFSSNRFGNDDIFVIPAAGGLPVQLTYFSSNDRVCDWTADGKTVLFTSRRDFYYNRMAVMYKVTRKNGETPTKVAAAYLNSGKLSPDGQWLVYSRGRENWARKHYRGSSNADIWRYNLTTKQFKRLTTHNGNDYYPLWSADSKKIFYVSDKGDDIFNLWQMDLNGETKKQLTFFKTDAVRFPNISRDGNIIAFEQDVNIWTFKTAGGELQKLNIYAPSDVKSNLVENKTFQNKASEMIVAPDEKQAAFVVRGEIFVVKLKEKNKTGVTKKLTNTWARERNICWAPNSDTLLYISDRNGNDDIFMLFSDDPTEKKLYKTLKIKEVQLTKSKLRDINPKFSPCGKKIGYINGLGDVHVMDVTGKNDKTLVTGWSEPDYNWSPDSKWIAYSRNDNEFNSDIFIISAAGGESVNITQHPDDDLSPTWSQDGRKLGFVSERYGNTVDAWFVFLQKKDEEKTKQDWEDAEEAEKESEKKKKDEQENKKKKTVAVIIDFKDIHKRLRRLTSLPSNETNLVISPDGKLFAFSSNANGKWNLYTVKWDGSELKRLTNGDVSPDNIQFNKDGKKIYYLSKGKIKVISSDGKDNKTLPFKAKMKIDYRAERAQKFDEAWQILNERFYDANFHGVDWDAMKKKYRPLAIEAATTEDFNNIVKLLLGELNASHLGIYGPDDSPKTITGMLGLRFDESYNGKGLKVETVLPEGPCDQEMSKVSSGEVLLTIDGTEIASTTNIHQLLNDKVNEKIIIEVQAANGKKKRSLVVRPINQNQFNNLEYDRWVNEKRALVDRLSKGKVGYVHIRGMSMPSVEKFEMELYSVAHGKDGLIIDVRNNGGGWTTDMLLAILAPRPHAYTIPRGGGKGYPEDRLPLYSWSKPVVTMCNEWSFSNAEIFSHAIKGLNRGKVVGTPTGGLVISTGGTRLIDGASFRIPFRGWYAAYSGLNQENNGCIPDVIVWDLPGDAAKHIDRQLEKAVEVMLEGLK